MAPIIMAFAGDLLEMLFGVVLGWGIWTPLLIKLHRGVLYDPPNPTVINLLFNRYLITSSPYMYWKYLAVN